MHVNPHEKSHLKFFFPGKLNENVGKSAKVVEIEKNIKKYSKNWKSGIKQENNTEKAEEMTQTLLKNEGKRFSNQ